VTTVTVAWARARQFAARVPTPVALVGLVACSAALRWWAGSRVPTPWIVPDEVVYAELGRSLWSQAGFEILGEPTRFYSLVYPALAGLPLSLDDRELGYELLKPLQAIVMSLTAIPVYLWGRTLMRRRWAFAAAALTLTIPALAYSGLVMTEVAFYPIATLAAWAIARALARPTLGAQGLAVGTILLASATRLQGAVLAAVLVTAVALEALFERSLRPVRSLWPALAGLGAAAVAWTAWRLAAGGPASELFGAYRAAAEVGYTVSDAVLYARWHLADVLLMTGVVPLCAVCALTAPAVAGRERSAPARAYLAVAVALVAWLAVMVGIFASRHVGRLAERDLIAVCPVLFLGLALWVDRGAPRPRLATAGVAAAALGLMLALPVQSLITHAAIPDAFTVIPLERLQARRPGVDLQLLVDLLAAAAVAAFALVPRRFVAALPLVVGVFLAMVSIHASRVVAGEARVAFQATVGADKRWLDDADVGSVAYLYSGEVQWNGVWESLFWNRSLDRVYALLKSRVPGLTDAQQPSVGPLEDGRLVLADGSILNAGAVVASSALRLDGARSSTASPPGVALWRVGSAPRLSQWRQEVRRGSLVSSFLLIRYSCESGRFEVRVSSPTPQRLRLARNDQAYGSVRLEPGTSRLIRVDARPTQTTGAGLCSFGFAAEDAVAIERAAFVERIEAGDERVTRLTEDG
jgi:hypothetical protein